MKKSAIILCMLIFVIAGISFFFLPDTIPAHFNAQGEVYRYGSRFEIFIIPFCALVMNALFIVLEKVDPKKNHIEQIKKYVHATLCIANGILLITLCIMIIEALYPKTLNVILILYITLCVMFIAIGNMMPKFKSNYFMGIRTPWTLENEQVWFKTHRLGGKLWFYGGVLMLAGIFLPSTWMFGFLLIGTILLGAIPCIYSYICFKKITTSKEG